MATRRTSSIASRASGASSAWLLVEGDWGELSGQLRIGHAASLPSDLQRREGFEHAAFAGIHARKLEHRERLERGFVLRGVRTR